MPATISDTMHFARVAISQPGQTQADTLVGQDGAGSRLLLDNPLAGVPF